MPLQAKNVPVEDIVAQLAAMGQPLNNTDSVGQTCGADSSTEAGPETGATASAAEVESGEGGDHSAQGISHEPATAASHPLPAYLRLLPDTQSWQPPVTLLEQLRFVASLSPQAPAVHGSGGKPMLSIAMQSASKMAAKIRLASFYVSRAAGCLRNQVTSGSPDPPSATRARCSLARVSSALCLAFRFRPWLLYMLVLHPDVHVAHLPQMSVLSEVHTITGRMVERLVEATDDANTGLRALSLWVDKVGLCSCTPNACSLIVPNLTHLHTSAQLLSGCCVSAAQHTFHWHACPPLPTTPAQWPELIGLCIEARLPTPPFFSTPLCLQFVPGLPLAPPRGCLDRLEAVPRLLAEASAASLHASMCQDGAMYKQSQNILADSQRQLLVARARLAATCSKQEHQRCQVCSMPPAPHARVCLPASTLNVSCACVAAERLVHLSPRHVLCCRLCLT